MTVYYYYAYQGTVVAAEVGTVDRGVLLRRGWEWRRWPEGVLAAADPPRAAAVADGWQLIYCRLDSGQQT